MASFSENLDRLRNQQKLLALFIFGLVAVGLWIGISIFSSQRDSSIPLALKKLAEPLTPSINTEVLTQIERKETFSQEELSEFPIFRIVQQSNRGEEVIISSDEELEQLIEDNQENN